MPCKKREFHKAATKKGFIEARKGDHIFYWFTDTEGKRYTRIHTKISHGGSGDISDNLLSKMYKEMKFDSVGDLKQYIECSLNEKMYREQLRAKEFQV